MTEDLNLTQNECLTILSALDISFGMRIIKRDTLEDLKDKIKEYLFKKK